jgi:hypothetical protein
MQHLQLPGVGMDRDGGGYNDIDQARNQERERIKLTVRPPSRIRCADVHDVP